MWMGSVWTRWVQRSVNGLGVNTLVVSVKRKIQNLQGLCPLTRKEVVDMEVAMVSVPLGDGHWWCVSASWDTVGTWKIQCDCG